MVLPVDGGGNGGWEDAFDEVSHGDMLPADGVDGQSRKPSLDACVVWSEVSESGDGKFDNKVAIASSNSIGSSTLPVASSFVNYKELFNKSSNILINTNKTYL